MIKKTIHFSNEDLKELDTLINILGVKGYGDIPKAIKFSVTFTIQELKRQASVLPILQLNDLEMWISSIKKLRKQEETEEKVKNLMEMTK